MKRLLLIPALVLLVACVSKGSIVAKHDYPGHWYWTTVPVYSGQDCTVINKQTTCTPRYIYVPQQQYEPEHWTLTIHDHEETAEVDVSKEIFERAELGNYYDSKTQTLTP